MNENINTVSGFLSLRSFTGMLIGCLAFFFFYEQNSLYFRVYIKNSVILFHKRLDYGVTQVGKSFSCAWELEQRRLKNFQFSPVYWNFFSSIFSTFIFYSVTWCCFPQTDNLFLALTYRFFSSHVHCDFPNISPGEAVQVAAWTSKTKKKVKWRRKLIKTWKNFIPGVLNFFFFSGLICKRNEKTTVITFIFPCCPSFMNLKKEKKKNNRKQNFVAEKGIKERSKCQVSALKLGFGCSLIKFPSTREETINSRQSFQRDLIPGQKQCA